MIKVDENTKNERNKENLLAATDYSIVSSEFTKGFTLDIRVITLQMAEY